MRPLVFKPSIGRAIFLVIVCVGFTLAGIWMMLSGGFFGVVIGLVSILFFGVGGVAAMIKMVRAGRTFAADEVGIHPGTGGLVPWENVGAIGPSTAGGATGLGVEVLDVAAFLDTLTPEQRRKSIHYAKAARLMLPDLGDEELGAADAQDAEVEARRAEMDALPEGEQGELQVMAWAKSANGGYDLLFAALTLNCLVEEAAANLEDYRAEALRRRVG